MAYKRQFLGIKKKHIYKKQSIALFWNFQGICIYMFQENTKKLKKKNYYYLSYTRSATALKKIFSTAAVMLVAFVYELSLLQIRKMPF